MFAETWWLTVPLCFTMEHSVRCSVSDCAGQYLVAMRLCCCTARANTAAVPDRTPRHERVRNP